MGNNIKKTVLIDFYGLPGSGKTTIFSLLTEKLRENGKLVDTIYGKGRTRPARQPVAKIMGTISALRFFLKVRPYLNKRSFYADRTFLRIWMETCLVFYRLRKAKHNEYIVADQGIIQAIVSLTANDDKANIEELVKIFLKNNKYEIIHVYVDIPVEVSLHRLETRQNGTSRVEKLKYDQRKAALFSLSTKFEKINSVLCPIVINNTDIEAEQAADILLSKILIAD